MKPIVKSIMAAILFLATIHCSGSNDATTNPLTTADSESLTQSTLQLVVTSANLAEELVSNLGSPPPTLMKGVASETSEIPCGDDVEDGFFTFEGDTTGNPFDLSITYDECTIASEDIILVTSGVANFTGTNDPSTSFTIEYTDFSTSLTNSSGTSEQTLNGTISATESGSAVTIELDLTALVEGNSVTIGGTMVITSNSIVNGDMTISSGDTELFSCTFVDFDVNTASSSDFANSCSAISS